MASLKTLTINGVTYEVTPVVPASSITLLASAWEGDGDAYSQVVTIPGVTSHTKVDLQPTAEQLIVFHDKVLAFVAENDGGVVTVFAVGDKPMDNHTIQITKTEVEGTGKIRGNTAGTTTPRSDWDQTDPTKADYIHNKPNLDDFSIVELDTTLSVAGKAADAKAVGDRLDSIAQGGGGGGSVKLDTTLSVEGMAADAKATGDAIAKEKAERQSEVAVERARINQFTTLPNGSTTGDAELADIRVGYNGRAYANAGEAVRGQVNALKKGYESFTSADLVQGGYSDTDWKESTSSRRIRFPKVLKVSKGAVVSIVNPDGLYYRIHIYGTADLTNPEHLAKFPVDDSIFTNKAVDYIVEQDGYLGVELATQYTWGTSVDIVPSDFTGEIRLYNTDRITELNDRVDGLADAIHHLDCKVDGYTGADFEQGYWNASGLVNSTIRIRLTKPFKVKKGDAISFEGLGGLYWNWVLFEDDRRASDSVALVTGTWTNATVYEIPQDGYFYVELATAKTYGTSSAIVPADFTGYIHHHGYDPRLEKTEYIDVPFTSSDFAQQTVDARYGLTSSTIRITIPTAIKVRKGEAFQFAGLGGLYWYVYLIQEDSINAAFTELQNTGWQNEEFFVIPQDCYAVVQLANAKTYGTSTAIVPADFTGYIKHLEYDPRIAELQSAADTYAVDTAKTKAFAALFDGKNSVEPFLFFTDPHLAQQSAWENEFATYTKTLKNYWESVPVENIICGGDWFDADTSDIACWKLGYIDAQMRSITENIRLVVGNHDTNESGTNPLTNNTIANLWHRKYGKTYYTFDTVNTKFFVLNSGSEITGADESQYDWFANELNKSTKSNIVIFFHMIRGSGNSVVKPFADTITKIAQAFNGRTSITANGVSYNFASASGKVRFVMAGHMHRDNTEVLNGIPIVETTQLRDGGKPTFDLCFADYDNNALHMVRIGTGSDRTISI